MTELAAPENVAFLLRWFVDHGIEDAIGEQLFSKNPMTRLRAETALAELDAWAAAKGIARA